MKNIKRMAVVAVIMGSIALFLSSCANSTAGGTSGETFTLNAAQKAHYEMQITYLVEVAANQDIPASDVSNGLGQFNNEAKALGYQVEDKQAGQGIARGTQADALRKRFVPKKA